MLRHLDLFSGIGGFALAARWTGGIQTVAFCEIDPYCRRVLGKNFPGVTIHEDIKKLRYTGSVDIISAGIPCQPYSYAGKRRGADDDRALWPECYRIIRESRPSWAVIENVAGFATMGLDGAKADLEKIGYEVGVYLIPAAGVGAPHRRDRLWIIARRGTSDMGTLPGGMRGVLVSHPRLSCLRMQVSRHRGVGRSGDRPLRIQASGDRNETISYTDSYRLQAWGELLGNREGPDAYAAVETHDCWAYQSRVCRVAYGLPARVDRMRSLGNAIVPQVAYVILKSIVEIERGYVR